MGTHEIAASIRMRAELALRLSSEIHEPTASAALREIADELKAYADKLEGNIIIEVQQPLNDA